MDRWTDGWMGWLVEWDCICFDMALELIEFPLLHDDDEEEIPLLLSLCSGR